MRLAADANVLLSAVLGGRARLVLEHPGVTEVFTAAPTLAEVEEYAAHLARRRRLRADVLLLAVAALPVTVLGPEEYAAQREEASRRIAARDPDDAEILAVALHLGIPLWSNDNDFEAAGVEWYTTAELLAKLGRRKPG